MLKTSGKMTISVRFYWILLAVLQGILSIILGPCRSRKIKLFSRAFLRSKMTNIVTTTIKDQSIILHISNFHYKFSYLSETILNSSFISYYSEIMLSIIIFR